MPNSKFQVINIDTDNEFENDDKGQWKQVGSISPSDTNNKFSKSKTNFPKRVSSLEETKRNVLKSKTKEDQVNMFGTQKLSHVRSCANKVCENCNQLMTQNNSSQSRFTVKGMRRKDKVVLLKGGTVGKRPSPYEANRNYKVLKDFFHLQVVESQLPAHMGKTSNQFKYHSNPINTNVNSNLGSAQEIPSIPDYQLNTSRTKDDMNADLHLKVDKLSQPDVRVKTTIGGYRSTSPNFYKIKDGSSKPGTSPKMPKTKHLHKSKIISFYFYLRTNYE